MKYLVAGGAGFIGSHITDILLDMGHEVIVLDNLSTGKKDNVSLKASFIEIDLVTASIDILASLFKDVTAVFHCAALPNVQFSIDCPLEANKSNLDTTIKILECMKYQNINKIIYSSSCSVYGNAINIPTPESESIKPLSPYALQKYIGEEYCRLYNRIYGINYTILRYFNVYGERMTTSGAYVSVLSHFLQSYRNKEPLNITNNGQQRRDFIYVKDVARANIMAALETVENGTIINLGSGTNYSINTIADWFGGNKKYGESRIEPFQTLADITTAKKILGWFPQQNLELWIKQNL